MPPVPGVGLMLIFPCGFAGTPADTAGGEEEDDGDGSSRGEERWRAGSLQWPLCLPL